MLKIKSSNQFFRDLKKHGLLSELVDALHYLINCEPLPDKYKDHQLTGNLKQYRECHIKPDLLLAYVVKDDILILVALDNHNNLFKILGKK